MRSFPDRGNFAKRPALRCRTLAEIGCGGTLRACPIFPYAPATAATGRRRRVSGVHPSPAPASGISRRDIYWDVPTQRPNPPFPALYRDLARFRYRLRVFLRFSERAARRCGVTPLQHQLMLGVAGFTGRGWATVSDLTEYLQHRHNAVVALVQRAQTAGLVSKHRDPADRRVIRVELTALGRRTLATLSRLHRGELARFHRDLAVIAAPRHEPTRRTPGAPSGAS
jgi:DNA-binding MarR family transcriptional regulator